MRSGAGSDSHPSRGPRAAHRRLERADSAGAAHHERRGVRQPRGNGAFVRVALVVRVGGDLGDLVGETEVCRERQLVLAGEQREAALAR